MACATVSMSLSPRPDRFTRTISSLLSVMASSTAWYTACEDSRAGMIPSARLSKWKPSRA